MKSLAGKISKKWQQLKERLEEKDTNLAKEGSLIPVNNENDWLDRLKHQRAQR